MRANLIVKEKSIPGVTQFYRDNHGFVDAKEKMVLCYAPQFRIQRAWCSRLNYDQRQRLSNAFIWYENATSIIKL